MSKLDKVTVIVRYQSVLAQLVNAIPTEIEKSREPGFTPSKKVAELCREIAFYSRMLQRSEHFKQGG